MWLHSAMSAKFGESWLGLALPKSLIHSWRLTHNTFLYRNFQYLMKILFLPHIIVAFLLVLLLSEFFTIESKLFQSCVKRSPQSGLDSSAGHHTSGHSPFSMETMLTSSLRRKLSSPGVADKHTDKPTEKTNKARENLMKQIEVWWTNLVKRDLYMINRERGDHPTEI